MFLESKVSPTQNTTCWVALTTFLCCLRSAGGSVSVNISRVYLVSVLVFSSPQFSEQKPSLYTCLHKLLPWQGGAASNSSSLMLEFTAVGLSPQRNPLKQPGFLSETCVTLSAPFSISHPGTTRSWLPKTGGRDLDFISHRFLWGSGKKLYTGSSEKLHTFTFMENLAYSFERFIQRDQ